MKKLIYFLALFSFIPIGVYAKDFNERVDPNYFYQVYWYDGKTHYSYKIFDKILDDEGKPFYNLSPRYTFYANSIYHENKIRLDKELLSKISKIIYYGYQYDGQDGDAYYFATQYLIYNALEGVKATFVDSNHLSIIYGEEEVKKIESHLEKGFSYKDFTTEKDFFLIEDSYVLDHFNILGEDILVEEKKVFLLNNKSEYEITFAPKNSCEGVNGWTYKENVHLLGRMPVCENTYKIKITREREEKIEESNQNPNEDTEDKRIPDANPDEIEENEKNPEQNKTELETISKEEDILLDENTELSEEESTMKVRDVLMPSTDKYRIDYIFFLLFLGNLYYAFKK